jgi:creatinine deaminase
MQKSSSEKHSQAELAAGSAGVDEFLIYAIREAEQGLAEGGIPIGSVLVYRGRVLGKGHNRRIQEGSPILHAEIDTLRAAGRQTPEVYKESILYTTLSPCSMCSGAVLLYGIPTVIIGENINFLGEEDLLRQRGVTVKVLQDARCIQLMREFTRGSPELWGEDIGVATLG